MLRRRTGFTRRTSSLLGTLSSVAITPNPPMVPTREACHGKMSRRDGGRCERSCFPHSPTMPSFSEISISYIRYVSNISFSPRHHFIRTFGLTDVPRLIRLHSEHGFVFSPTARRLSSGFCASPNSARTISDARRNNGLPSQWRAVSSSRMWPPNSNTSPARESAIYFLIPRSATLTQLRLTFCGRALLCSHYRDTDTRCARGWRPLF